MVFRRLEPRAPQRSAGRELHVSSASNPQPFSTGDCFQFHHQPFAYYARWGTDGSAAKAEHLQDEQNFFNDLHRGTLPSVSFIKPVGLDNEHPSYANVERGQQHVRELVQAVCASPYWKTSAIVITYDENGGRWDHVAPPKLDDLGVGHARPRGDHLAVRQGALRGSHAVRDGLDLGADREALRARAARPARCRRESAAQRIQLPPSPVGLQGLTGLEPFARLAILAAGLFAFAAVAGGERVIGPSTLAAPALPAIPEVRSVDGIATLALRAALDPERRPAFFWNGREVAPTIRVHPGDRIRLHYDNALPVICGLGMVSASNLHFHGLQSAPVPPGDDVLTTNVAPGTAYDYTIRIDRTQPPGLYWYHPHPHGLTNWEIGNGMSGAIVVEGIADELPRLSGLRERVIVLRDVPRDPSVAAAERPDRRGTVASASTAAPAADAEDFQGTTPCGVETDSQPTINGIANASIGMRPGERQLWRVVNAAGARHFDLAIPGMTMQLVALDGVPLGYYRGTAPVRTVDHIAHPARRPRRGVVLGPAHPQPRPLALLRRRSHRRRQSGGDPRRGRRRRRHAIDRAGTHPRSRSTRRRRQYLGPARPTMRRTYPRSKKTPKASTSTTSRLRAGPARAHRAHARHGRGVDAREQYRRSSRVSYPPSPLRRRSSRRRPQSRPEWRDIVDLPSANPRTAAPTPAHRPRAHRLSRPADRAERSSSTAISRTTKTPA